jgi:hypothetical protein
MGGFLMRGTIADEEHQAHKIYLKEVDHFFRSSMAKDSLGFRECFYLLWDTPLTVFKDSDTLAAAEQRDCDTHSKFLIERLGSSSVNAYVYLREATSCRTGDLNGLVVEKGLVDLESPVYAITREEFLARFTNWNSKAGRSLFEMIEERCEKSPQFKEKGMSLRPKPIKAAPKPIKHSTPDVSEEDLSFLIDRLPPAGYGEF